MSTKTVILSSLGFLVGAAGGAVAGYFFARNKFLTLAEKEIESVRKVYENHFSANKKDEDIQKTEPILKETPSIKDDKEVLKNYTKMYSGESQNPASLKGELVSKRSIGSPKITQQQTKPKQHIYVISSEQYRDSEYDAETLIWYSDKVLADSDGNVIHNINEVIGPEALNTFGRYLDDTVYVRDDLKEIDYEIIWNSRSFASINKLQGSKEPLEDD